MADRRCQTRRGAANIKRSYAALLTLSLAAAGLLIICFASGSAHSARAATGDWPLYGHDPSRTNFNPDETIISASNINQLVSRWQANIGSDPYSSSSSAPSVSGGSVYVGSSAPSGPNFFAFGAQDGSLHWSVNLSHTDACWNVGIGSTPAISGTLVSVGGGDSAYYGLDTTSGSIVWRNDMAAGPSAFPWASPLLANGRCYVGVASYCDNPSVRGEVRAVDIGNGASLASQYFVPAGTAGGGVWNSPALSPDGSTLVVATGEDYSCGANCQYTRAMVALDPLTLQILGWHQEGPVGEDQDYGTTPIVFHDSQGRTLVGANHKDGTFYTYLLNDLNSGPIWSRSLGVTVGMMPAYDPTHGPGGTLFIPGGAGNLYAVDPATGADMPGWSPGGLSYEGNLAIANGLIFVNGGSGGLRILNESTGALLRILAPANAGGTASGVAVANGFIYWVSGSYLNAWSLPGSPPSPTPVTTPTPGAVLVGHVTWQGPPPQPSARQQLPVTLTLSLNGVNTDYPSQVTDAGGYFTVTVTGLPPGTYNWRVKGPRYLANCGTVSLNGSSTSAEMGLVRVGDSNGDNVSNITDFTILRATFGGTSDLRADFNNDSLISTPDFILLRSNLGLSGCSPPRMRFR